MTHPDQLKWMDDGICTGYAPGAWDSFTAAVRSKACRTCPVRRPCSDFMGRRWPGQAASDKPPVPAVDDSVEPLEPEPADSDLLEGADHAEAAYLRWLGGDL